MTYKGRSTTSGNSRGISFETALFRSHPEFAGGRFEADVLGPGTLLVRAVPDPDAPADEEHDPILEAYLAFLEREMREHPERIQPLSSELIREAEGLVGHLDVDMDEDLGDDAFLP